MAIRRGQDKNNVTELFIKAYMEMIDPKEASEIMLKLAKYLQSQGCCKEAIECLDQGLVNNVNLEAESHSIKLYSTKIELMKSIEPAHVINICDDAMNSKIDDASKIKFAEEKVEMAQSLGASLNIVKAAEKEIGMLRAKCDSSCDHLPEKKLKKFVCDKCREKFVNSKNLTNHLRVMHSGGEKCERCNSMFDDKALLLKHKQSKTCFWQCEHCKYKSLKYSNVMKHVKSVHKHKIAGINALESSNV